MTTNAITPKEKKQLLRKRISRVLPKLPERWQNLFVFVWPEYTDNTRHLSNVREGKSLDEDVVIKLELLALQLQSIKKELNKK